MFLSQLITVAIVHLFAVMTPGPDFAIVTRNSLVYSRKIGVYTSLGIALGISVHVLYSLLGIGLLISKSIILFNIIKFIGAGYLIYIGYKSLKAKPISQSENEEILKKQNNISSIKAFNNGFLTNVLNPKVTLFFLALFTQIINPDTSSLVQLIFGLETMSATFIWFSIVSVLFSNNLIKNKITKFQHRIEKVTGVILIALGIKIAMTNHN